MDIDVTLVRDLVAAQFPRWADLPVTRVAKPGVDNATLRLGADMSVRLPRFERWIGQVHREQRWLPVLAPRLPLPVPIPLAQGEPSATYPYPWSVYRWLDGDRADQVPLDLPTVALDLAEFLLALQAIETTDGPQPEWSNGFRGADLADPRDSPVVTNRLEARIGALRGLTDTDALTEVWQAGLAAPAWDRPPVWVHGDLGPRPGMGPVRSAARPRRAGPRPPRRIRNATQAGRDDRGPPRLKPTGVLAVVVPSLGRTGTPVGQHTAHNRQHTAHNGQHTAHNGQDTVRQRPTRCGGLELVQCEVV
ncbi:MULTISPECIES: phosphotransferase [unclassified Crossiella]|uniref:phosphotransferase n=1 Tax=unclassified Crossiella TaxID=2620835 RepID=UPI0020001CE4|nr:MULTISPECIES: phosphotransferase [unclassified Crossiella]MCK2241575.1 phosphotransferase [Crossiella sp. S99.2]MCK2255553.1 phosphotransferase [Crossiella sp. S99.1]